MMKRNLILYSCLLLLLLACKKNDNNNSASSSSWTFAGKNYTASSVAYVVSGNVANLDATAAGGSAYLSSGLLFAFAVPPTASGQMLITNTNAPNTVLAGITIVSQGTNTFYANDPTNVSANVTVQNGKVSVSFPGTIWLHNMANHADSAQLSVGTITQQ
jgi:hypothetical protein